ncbi:MAG TPA: phosphatase [Rariglobus sp.]|jgi:exopolyphosphatase/guanosine-5'-triphosphate,3'-diphosphate pyrophosphatase|nr:phosphatase [Rariglobus sp.]
MVAPVVAVIDIGSNSIKVLVARQQADGRLILLKGRTIDARISAGISKAEPKLTEEGMSRGLSAIKDLLADTAPFQPSQVILVATSAVRDALNGDEFRRLVLASTGHAIRILTGDEEANLIGRGLTCDPALVAFHDFHVFDLGGGSLECLTFKNRTIAQGLSLRLGCVRLTERFVSDPAASFPASARDAIAAHTQAEIARSGFRFDLPHGQAVFAGGSMTAVRLIRGARDGQDLSATSPVVTVAELDHLFQKLAPLTLAERLQFPGLPAGRADVFPAALVTMLTIAEAGGIETFHHTLYNLRWGIASEALSQA